MRLRRVDRMKGGRTLLWPRALIGLVGLMGLDCASHRPRSEAKSDTMRCHCIVPEVNRSAATRAVGERTGALAVSRRQGAPRRGFRGRLQELRAASSGEKWRAGGPKGSGARIRQEMETRVVDLSLVVERGATALWRNQKGGDNSEKEEGSQSVLSIGR